MPAPRMHGTGIRAPPLPGSRGRCGPPICGSRPHPIPARPSRPACPPHAWNSGPSRMEARARASRASRIPSGSRARMPHAGGEDGCPIVRRKLAVCLVEDDLALLRMLPHAREQVVGDDDRRASPEEGEGMHMAAQPCILLHVQRRLGIGVSAEWQGGHEEARLRHLAGRGAHKLHRGPRPVDLERPSRLVATLLTTLRRSAYSAYRLQNRS